MSQSSDPARQAIEDVLGPAGFRRKGNSWYLRSSEVVELLNLQKSRWGPTYYLNFAVWLLALGNEVFPNEEKCHVRLRADSIAPSERELEGLLSLESGVSDSDRRTALSRFLESYVLPFAAECETVAGLRSLLATGKLRKALIRAEARILLEPPSQPP